MKPLISVIVPVYNVEKFLPKCLDSILMQTYKNLEIILVDDGSRDKGGFICDEYAPKDERVIVLHQENAGISEARNAALKIFRGEYLIFVDSDDYLDQDAIRCLYMRMLQDGSDMVIGNAVGVDEKGSILGDLYVRVKDGCKTQKTVYEELGGHNSVPCWVWGKLYKREIFRELRFPAGRYGEDLWILVDIIERCRVISSCDTTIYYYTQRMSSIMHTLNDTKIEDNISAALRVAKKLVEKGYCKAAKNYYTSAVSQAIDMKNVTVARRRIRGSFPWYLRIRLAKYDVHSLIRWVALYVPAARRMLVKRHARK